MRGGDQHQGGEEESKRERPARSMCCPIIPYRGICTCAEHVHVRAVHAMRSALLEKSTLASPHATLCASASLQVVVAVFSEARKR